MTGTFLMGFGHRAGQGKSTICQMIHEQDSKSTRIYAFADALKAHCRALGLMQQKDPSVLQTVGTLYRRRDQNFWIRLLEWKISDEQPRIALISDLRYGNEARWIKESGGLTVNVRRLQFDGNVYTATDRDTTHSSETDLTNYEFDRTLTTMPDAFEDMAKSAKSLLELAHLRMA